MTVIREMVTLALQQHQAGRLDQAEELYRRILQVNPHHPDALHLLGVLISQRGRHDLAVTYIEQAIAVKPDMAAFHNNLGFSYQALGRMADAEVQFYDALRLQPNFAMAQNNLGKTRREQGRLAEAMACYEKSLALDPHYAEAHFNRAELWLLLGDFARGWPEYEWRWRLPVQAARSAHPPRWDGSALDGKTIMLHAEQGLGDTIQFVRYAPLVKQRGGQVIVHCQPALLPLLTGFPGIDRLTPWRAPLPAFDVQEQLLSLPGVFGTSVANVPAPIPYLHADSKLVASWRRELEPLGGFKIGISWKGSPKNLSDRKRSIPLASFAKLAELPGVRLLSLQKGPGIEELQALEGKFPVLDLGPRLDEAAGAFLDTAAIMMNIDLVIGCDSAIPHLAGALGVPAWLALPSVPDWRWLLERDSSPWYPTLRLFRQMRLGDWGEVFERMAEEITAIVARRGDSGSVEKQI